MEHEEKQGQLVSCGGMSVTCGNIGTLAGWNSHVAASTHHYFNACVARGCGTMPTFDIPHSIHVCLLDFTVRSRYRQRFPPNMDPRVSYVDAVSPDEVDEELDGFPSTRPADVIRIR